MYIDNAQQMDGIFSKVGKAVNKVVKAPLRVATKVASKVLPDKLEKAALAVPKLTTNLAARTVTATAKLSDAATSPFARAVKKNPLALQAAGAVASVVPGLQPVGAALIGSGRIIQQRNAQRTERQARAGLEKMQIQMQIDALKPQAAPHSTVITVPGGGGNAGGSVASPPPVKDNTALYVGAGIAAVAFLALSNRTTRR